MVTDSQTLGAAATAEVAEVLRLWFSGSSHLCPISIWHLAHLRGLDACTAHKPLLRAPPLAQPPPEATLNLGLDLASALCFSEPFPPLHSTLLIYLQWPFTFSPSWPFFEPHPSLKSVLEQWTKVISRKIGSAEDGPQEVGQWQRRKSMTSLKHILHKNVTGFGVGWERKGGRRVCVIWLEVAPCWEEQPVGMPKNVWEWSVHCAMKLFVMLQTPSTPLTLRVSLLHTRLHQLGMVPLGEGEGVMLSKA